MVLYIYTVVAIAIGYYASYWNLPIISHGASDPILSDKKTFDTVVRVRPGYDKIGYAFLEILNHFNWDLITVSDYQVFVLIKNKNIEHTLSFLRRQTPDYVNAFHMHVFDYRDCGSIGGR